MYIRKKVCQGVPEEDRGAQHHSIRDLQIFARKKRKTIFSMKIYKNRLKINEYKRSYKNLKMAFKSRKIHSIIIKIISEISKFNLHTILGKYMRKILASKKFGPLSLFNANNAFRLFSFPRQKKKFIKKFRRFF